MIEAERQALAEKAMGRKAQFLMGSCFDAAAIVLRDTGSNRFQSLFVCHGLGIANAPGQEGEVMAHAWLEYVHPTNIHVAYDPIWGIAKRRSAYHRDLKVSHVVRYAAVDFLKRWTETGFPGPWDERVREVAAAYTAQSSKR